jgi:uncharacterized membrane protein YfcA
MLSSLFNITFIAESCALIAAFVLLNKKTTIWRLFKALLFITLFVEAVGWYLAYIIRISNNNWIFNILLLISSSFTIWMLTNADTLKKERNILMGGVVFFIAFGLCNLFFFQGLWKYNGFTEIIGDLIISIYSCYFFYKALAENIYRDLFQYEYFWIAIGLMVSSIGSAILYIFLDSLTAFYRHTHINIYGYINYILNIILYGSLIIAFICRNRNTR